MNAPNWARPLPWALILEKAKEHKLDPVLVAAICHEESGGITWRTRYEPGYPYLVTPQIFAQRLLTSVATEIAHQQTSWSHLQIMGANARALGYADYLPKICAQPDLAIHYGCKFLANLVERYEKLELVVASYNAGSPQRRADGKLKNQGYVDRVLKLLARR
jgi:hypothetical protein